MSEKLPAIGAENWCHTKVEAITFSFLWSIDNFRLCREATGEYFESPTFSPSPDHEMRWCLAVYPNGYDEARNNYVSLFVKLESCGKSNLGVKIKLAVLNTKQEKQYVKEFDQVFVFDKSKSKPLGYAQFVKREFLLNEENGLIQDNKVTFYCEITASTDYVNTVKQSFPIKVPDCNISDDFGKLFDNREFSDVILIVDGHELLAHKTILAARSSVFAAMFKHNMEEKKSNRVEITDMDYATLKELLRFTYTGKAQCLDKLARNLLVASNKYALDRLRVMCEEALRSSLSIDNALDVLVLADKHNADQLKAHAVDFVIHHAADVVKTSSWKSVELHHSHLVMQAFKALADLPCACKHAVRY